MYDRILFLKTQSFIHVNSLLFTHMLVFVTVTHCIFLHCILFITLLYFIIIIPHKVVEAGREEPIYFHENENHNQYSLSVTMLLLMEKKRDPGKFKDSLVDIRNLFILIRWPSLHEHVLPTTNCRSRYRSLAKCLKPIT